MLDIKFIRENSALVKKIAKEKRVEVDIDKLLKLDEKRRAHIVKLEGMRAQQRKLGSGHKGKPPKEIMVRLKELSDDIKVAQEAQNTLDEEYQKLLWTVPNIVHESVPHGKDESENKIVRKVGKHLTMDFHPKEHWELGAALGIIDIVHASEVSGARFAYLKGKLALLQFALINFALSVLTDEKKLAQIAKDTKLKVSTKPFTAVIPPVLMRPEIMNKMARLEPREERYHIESDDLYLVGSAEHTLGPLHMNETLKEEDLPIRYVGYSTSFRREAGTYGKDTKGIMRVHQFDKVEMESFTTPEQGIAEQDFLIAIQEYLMQALGIPYQVVFKCTGDMGAPDYREFDIEAFMPGQGRYRETHTADYMTDYQARRLNTKVKHADGRTEFVHMNDATAIALSRTPVAILENYQQKDGSIKVPEALVPFCGFSEIK
ncbi:serine--tRNA ligase [Candidatus Uhrbacteria bacterium RIFCSPLOWO2_01_FULL_47_24]|uniref:Serine--tRNA ligase n=1 Tax=Candidatus Uhrbacteria bacterium RIFCSPLOWO2_01_FULL_47_24 TaxID=1802401 RepID=A0A1F7URZ5_9BACT|nr:MAG: serine--tRNA ligase [Candidatus Uhrbacteria bacterium RIFCSPHIGHO2_01_FULL_47_11]OGL68689.1 MAG: serine--tRNA ligase [Candidatus Uhrbacteria bacterium RIFCSPHIGHO2_02_FULL_46_47]OGL74966.1 MAG: serine--tRNA ligase [Candidatus Uhrbacteria bacterium RIFCSPHIGHO2_12_FULL_47_11]OGL81061.1 MAG: serine--tRNA ligase [Candidatus Uhrbacteria bacterium RIFCSPLOWO2_01_FULL_47_24]OGL84580.1 MAG: serine--tRNA ligase [Candidatus Uhrbacteria bacterium RIFCSPLOWO2_02_FULL_46_25]OGL93019.1 MAG: serine-